MTKRQTNRIADASAVVRTVTDAPEPSVDAAGVGGLVAVSIDGTYYLPCYDHNGNVVAYVSESGGFEAQYVYTPFGEVMSQSGTMADIFRFRFSTKYQDEATGLYYYGYRFYDPELIRFLNRDPIEKDDGDNVYGFAGNDPVTYFDAIGWVKGEVKHRPWWTPEVEDVDLDGFGKIRAFLSENECTCKCNAYQLNCRLSINYTIKLLPKDSPKWEKSVPASYLTFPVPDDYKAWPLAKKRKFVENHERKHLDALKAWRNRRVEQLEGLEALQFSSDDCENQQERVVQENEKQFRACYNDELNHEHW